MQTFKREMLYNTMLGPEHAPESRAKMTLAKMGNTHRLGTTQSDETRAKMSAAHAGDKNHFYGRKHSDEMRATMSASRMGKTASPETRARMSETQRARWAARKVTSVKYQYRSRPVRTDHQMTNPESPKRRSHTDRWMLKSETPEPHRPLNSYVNISDCHGQYTMTISMPLNPTTTCPRRLREDSAKNTASTDTCSRRKPRLPIRVAEVSYGLCRLLGMKIGFGSVNCGRASSRRIGIALCEPHVAAAV